MAKKEPTLQDAVTKFLDMMKRSNYVNFIRENNVLYGKNKRRVPIFLYIDRTLWNALPEEFTKNVRELDMSLNEDVVIQSKFLYTQRMDGIWIPIEDEVMASNQLFDIEVKNGPCNITLNSKVFPFRFKKEDMNNFSYKLHLEGEEWYFIIKKIVDGPVPDTSFTIVRCFKIPKQNKGEQ